MKILATSIYSAGGQFTEAAIEESGMESFCLDNCLFDTEPEESVIKLKAYLKEGKFKAIILDGHWTPSSVTAISFGQLQFAKELLSQKVSTFFLLRKSDSGHACELWRFGRKMKFRDMETWCDFLVKIESFDHEYFTTEKAQVVRVSGGDGGEDHLLHMLRNGHAFTERDWPSIKCAVEKELKENKK